MHSVPHLGDLAEQHGGAALHQHVGGVAGAGVGGEAGEGVGAAALHADEQLAEGQLLPAALVEPFQLPLGHLHQGLHHGVVAPVVLEGEGVLRGDVLRGEHHVVGELFTAQAHHHQFAAEVGVADEVGDRPDGDVGLPGLNGHAAAVGVVHCHHAVHIGVLGQQLPLDALHRHVDHTGGALDGGDNAQQVAGAGGAGFVAVAHPGSAGRIGQLFHGDEAGPVGHVVQAGGLRQVQHVLVDPGPNGDGSLGVAQHHAVADHLAPLGDVSQGDLVGLGDVLPGDDAGHDPGAAGDVVDRDGYVVRVLDLDVKRCAHRRITPFWPMSFHRTRGAPDGMTSRCYDDYCLPESSFSWRLALRLSRTA